MKGTSKVACPLFHEQQKTGEKLRAKKILFSILILFFSLLIKTSPCIANEVSLTLIYTSNTLGEVESCGCPEADDAGGLGRRSYYIDTSYSWILMISGGITTICCQKGSGLLGFQSPKLMAPWQSLKTCTETFGIWSVKMGKKGAAQYRLTREVASLRVLSQFGKGVESKGKNHNPLISAGELFR